jgi:hypothetical protein
MKAPALDDQDGGFRDRNFRNAGSAAYLEKAGS